MAAVNRVPDWICSHVERWNKGPGHLCCLESHTRLSRQWQRIPLKVGPSCASNRREPQHGNGTVGGWRNAWEVTSKALGSMPQGSFFFHCVFIPSASLPTTFSFSPAPLPSITSQTACCSLGIVFLKAQCRAHHKSLESCPKAPSTHPSCNWTLWPKFVLWYLTNKSKPNPILFL